jgi:hypothetical protein
MAENLKTDEKTVLLRIQNRQKPYEIIHVVWDRKNNTFETEGLKDLFGLKEIRMESRNFLQSLERYSQVLSFLLETMSEAKNYNVRYAYQSEFEFGGEWYTLQERGDYRVLKLVGEDDLKNMPMHS